MAYPEISIGDYKCSVKIKNYNRRIILYPESEHIVPAIHDIFNKEVVKTEDLKTLEKLSFFNIEV